MNIPYDIGRKMFALGQINWEEDALYGLLVSAGYTFNVSHTTLASIDGSAGGPRDYSQTGSTPNFMGYALTNKSVLVNGTTMADPIRFPNVPVGRPPATQFIIYRKAPDNDPAQSPLIYYVDTATGFPITPNGGDIRVIAQQGFFRL